MTCPNPPTWALPFLFAFVLGAIFQGCFGARPAYGWSPSIGESADRIAKALERVAGIMEKRDREKTSLTW